MKWFVLEQNNMTAALKYKHIMKATIHLLLHDVHMGFAHPQISLAWT